jgi:hypothetical protein
MILSTVWLEGSTKRLYGRVKCSQNGVVKMVDASAYFLSRGWLRIYIFTKPTPPPAISVSVICDRIALIAHTFKRMGLI